MDNKVDLVHSDSTSMNNPASENICIALQMMPDGFEKKDEILVGDSTEDEDETENLSLLMNGGAGVVDGEKSERGSASIHQLYSMEEDDSKQQKVELVWRNLSYFVNVTAWKRTNSFPWVRFTRTKKTILDSQSGLLKTGVLTAVIGPSGAGKSTFLECLSGRRRTNQRGEVFVCKAKASKKNSLSGRIENIKEWTVSFIGQKDHLIGVLTVRESLLFASRLKNYKEEQLFHDGCKADSLDSRVIATTSFSSYHTWVVESVLSDLGLENCADVLVSRCSGGQTKRLSIALELVSKPKILILDEPTSGLDSSSALQCVQLLKKLTTSRHKQKAPLGIIASIHQPSARVLYLFKNLYLLSNDGRCLYHGPASNLLPHLSKYGLKCPQFHNPADFVIEISSGEHGKKVMNDLASFQSERHSFTRAEYNQSCSTHKITTVVDRMTRQRFPCLLHTWLLLQRTWISTVREPMLTWLRLAQHIFTAFVAAFMYNYTIGEPDGCFDELTKAITVNLTSPSSSMDSIQKNFLKQQSITSDNASFIFFVILFLAFANTMSTVLTFPLEMAVFIKERRNAWYACGTYYTAKFLADTPFQIVIPFIFCCIAYPATGQIPSLWRFAMYCLVAIMVASISQSLGILFGIVFLENLGAAVFMACLSLTPFFLLGGFFTSYSGVSVLFKPVTILSFVRYCYESMIIIIYGFNRCSGNLTASSLSPSQSSMANIACLLGSTVGQVPDMTSLTSGLSVQNLTGDHLAELLSIDPVCADTLMDHFDQFRVSNNTETMPATKSRDSEQFSSSSYMLTHLELTEDVLWQNLIILTGFLIALRIGAYLLLLYKANLKLKE